MAHSRIANRASKLAPGACSDMGVLPVLAASGGLQGQGIKMIKALLRQYAEETWQLRVRSAEGGWQLTAW